MWKTWTKLDKWQLDPYAAHFAILGYESWQLINCNLGKVLGYANFNVYGQRFFCILNIAGLALPKS